MLEAWLIPELSSRLGIRNDPGAQLRGYISLLQSFCLGRILWRPQLNGSWVPGFATGGRSLREI